MVSGMASPGADASSADARDEDALVDALRRGDEQAFARIVDAWSPGMLRLARCHVSTDASAQEVVQEAWLGAVRGLASFEGRSRLRTWVLRIVVNIARSRGQQEHRVTPFSSIAPAGEPTVDPDRFRPPADPYAGGWRVFPAEWPAIPESEILSAETREIVRAALDGLPEAQRTVMALRDIHGYQAAEVCDALGLTAANQRVLLHRARAAVRRQIEVYLTDRAPAGGLT
jgi:RNA polymerase sigma-70 factor (ECF subfamily)